MNGRDLDNLHFLLKADKKTLEDWYSKSTPDDHEYACELMKAYQKELFVKLELLKCSDSQVNDTSDANSILGRYML